MKNFKWLFLCCAFLFIVGIFLTRSANIQAEARTAGKAVSAANYQLASVATISSRNVWAVGKTGTKSSFSSLIEHWDGKNWQIVPSPNPVGSIDTELTAVTALSCSNIWAVGFALVSGQSAQQSVIEHWNGISWKLVKSPSQPGNTRLQGVAALSASNIWAVGYSMDSLQREFSLIEHWNGSQWQIITNPNPSASLNELTGISAISPQDIWAVGLAFGYTSTSAAASPLSGGPPLSGFHPLAEQWNGSVWTTVAVPDPIGELQHDVYQSVTATSSTDVWAVGHSFTPSTTSALIAHWNGTNWQTVQSPSPGINGILTSVAALSPQDIWAVGSYQVDENSPAIPFTEHWNGQQWIVVSLSSGNVGSGQANGVSAFSPQDAWLVEESGLTEHWNGIDWQVVPTPIP
jgi:hypothetical protein